LIELGADVNIGTDMNTPLYLAVNNKHENIVKLLLRQVCTRTLVTSYNFNTMLQQINHNQEATKLNS